jgi:hypothetical protein
MFAELVGSPKEATIPNDAVIWEPTDEPFIASYRQAVSGLVMAKAMPQNVVQMPTRKQ